jgi:hypothetical protein
MGICSAALGFVEEIRLSVLLGFRVHGQADLQRPVVGARSGSSDPGAELWSCVASLREQLRAGGFEGTLSWPLCGHALRKPEDLKRKQFNYFKLAHLSRGSKPSLLQPFLGHLAPPCSPLHLVPHSLINGFDCIVPFYGQSTFRMVPVTCGFYPHRHHYQYPCSRSSHLLAAMVA